MSGGPTGFIFGEYYNSNGIPYDMRSPSAGSQLGIDDFIGVCGSPESNEWDRILDKNPDYIKNWKDIYSWGQDTDMQHETRRALRRQLSNYNWSSYEFGYANESIGFRPVLELPEPGTSGMQPDSLKVVTLNLNGGSIGTEKGPINIVVNKHDIFTAPSAEGLTRPEGNGGTYLAWKDEIGRAHV